MAAPTGGKVDMERIGLFQEMGYISIAAPYVSPSNSISFISSDNFNVNLNICIYKIYIFVFLKYSAIQYRCY